MNKRFIAQRTRGQMVGFDYFVFDLQEHRIVSELTDDEPHIIQMTDNFNRQELYDLLYVITRRTNPNSTYARHINVARPGGYTALCGHKPRGGSSWSTDAGQPTCKKCRKLAGLED